MIPDSRVAINARRPIDLSRWVRHHRAYVRAHRRPSRQPRVSSPLLIAALIVTGCAGVDPLASSHGSAAASDAAPSTAGSDRPSGQPSGPPASTVVEPGDPVAALTGRAVEGIATGGPDVVLRIGAEGFRVGERESLFDVDGERVLTARVGPKGTNVVLVVSDLEGKVLREIDSGMHLPQTGIVRGDDVYFGGLDLGPEGDDIDAAKDRGAWVARGDAPPERIYGPDGGVAVYSEFLRSPNGRTVGIWRCGVICSSILVGPEDRVIEIPKPGLFELADEVTLVIGAFGELIAYRSSDGGELWRTETTGLFYDRYVTSDGRSFVLSAIEPVDGGGPGARQLRVDVVEALSGAVERSVVLPLDGPQLFVAATLSTDRYVALLDSVLPNPDDGPHTVRVIDLEAGKLLDIELTLGSVPDG